MSNKETTTKETDPSTGETSNEGAGAQSFGGMCQAFAEMGSRMMAGETPDCCRPGASADIGSSKTSNE